jgi:hypothetical protein
VSFHLILSFSHLFFVIVDKFFFGLDVSHDEGVCFEGKGVKVLATMPNDFFCDEWERDCAALSLRFGPRVHQTMDGRTEACNTLHSYYTKNFGLPSKLQEY